MDLMTKIISAHRLHEKHTDISRIALVPEDLHPPFFKSTLPGSNAGGKWASLSLFHFILRLFLLDKWWMKSFIVSACISMAAICLRAPFVWRHGRKQLYWFDSELNLPQVSLQTMPNLWVKWQTGWQKKKRLFLTCARMWIYLLRTSLADRGLTFWQALIGLMASSRLRQNACFSRTRPLRGFTAFCTGSLRGWNECRVLAVVLWIV